MISKNKKKLLSAYIASLTMCSVANGGEYLSQEEKSRKDEEIIKLIEKNSSVVIDYESAYKGNAYIVEIQGDAWNKLIERYIPIRNSKTYSGHAGNVRKFIRLSDGKTVMVKCIPNTLIGMKTDHVQSGSIQNELRFFEKIKNYKYHPGIVNCYDIFSDDNVTYIVQDWLEGQTLGNLPEELKEQSFAWKKRFVYQMIKKMFETMKFTEKNLKILHLDQHGGNWIIVPKNPNEENIAKKYEDFDLYLIDWGEYRELNQEGLKFYENIPEQYYMSGDHKKLTFIARISEEMGKLMTGIACRLGIKKTNASVWWKYERKNQEYCDLYKDFFRRCSMGSEGQIMWDYENQEYLDEADEDEKVIHNYFQNYDEIIKYCNDKIKEAEKEMEISK